MPGRRRAPAEARPGTARRRARMARVSPSAGHVGRDRLASYERQELRDDWADRRTPARRPRAGAWDGRDDEAPRQRLRDGTVADKAAAAPPATEPGRVPFPAPRDARLAVLVSPGITHTIGGLRVDDRARVLDEDGTAIDGLFAAGADVGGISTGGYASGLAAARVLGLPAAEPVVG